MTIRIINADVLDGLRQLPDESVHCVVTSPPYWGLRDYGTATWEGGEAGCDHKGSPQQSKSSTLAGNGHGNGKPLSPQLQAMATPYRDLCGKCGARRIDKQIGLEDTPQAFVARMVEVFREVRRVLRPDGTCWVNLGDSYATGTNADRPATTITGPDVPAGWSNRSQAVRRHPGGLKPKDLIGIPWRVAFALQDDGWWLRQDIIWHKPNPMPESVTDRCTKAHEYIFLLTKSARYFYDAEAVKEEGAEPDRQRSDRIGGANGHTVRHSPGAMIGASATRNKRSVWTIATAPFAEAHFATFPPELPEICIKAGTSAKGCCSQCGAPWVRETLAQFIPQPNVSREKGIRGAFDQKPLDASNKRQGFPRGTTQRETTGWSPACACGADVVSCIVLDPFGGAGTTALVADRLQRNAILIELNPEYAAMAERRINGDRGSLLDLMEAAQ